MYNKRTWLNKETSPSTGSIVAFDGDINYSDGKEKTTFLEIADCKNKIRLFKNTESMDDFIDKLMLLRNEIDNFIFHLENNK